jgi:hypothetical protein
MLKGYSGDYETIAPIVAFPGNDKHSSSGRDKLSKGIKDRQSCSLHENRRAYSELTL